MWGGGGGGKRGIGVKDKCMQCEEILMRSDSVRKVYGRFGLGRKGRMCGLGKL